mmetsp:Transcript_22120/g.71232  ORF Transcript_22120/g.71232 Transcript_22120/m.71232 type:complete len:212 (-) Transcript_22120:655-1290(-)
MQPPGLEILPLRLENPKLQLHLPRDARHARRPGAALRHFHDGHRLRLRQGPRLLLRATHGGRPDPRRRDGLHRRGRLRRRRRLRGLPPRPRVHGDETSHGQIKEVPPQHLQRRRLCGPRQENHRRPRLSSRRLPGHREGPQRQRRRRRDPRRRRRRRGRKENDTSRRRRRRRQAAPGGLDRRRPRASVGERGDRRDQGWQRRLRDQHFELE